MSFLEHGIKRYGHIIVKLDAFALSYMPLLWTIDSFPVFFYGASAAFAMPVQRKGLFKVLYRLPIA
jgi:hypothetical protein